MEMPAPDQAVIARRDEIAAALRQIVPGEGVILSEPERRAYESDGLTAYHQSPLIVVLPSTLAAVAAVLRYCKAEGIKVVPRGAGTSLSGGALPLADGVLLVLFNAHHEPAPFILPSIPRTAGWQRVLDTDEPDLPANAPFEPSTARHELPGRSLAAFVAIRAEASTVDAAGLPSAESSR